MKAAVFEVMIAFLRVLQLASYRRRPVFVSVPGRGHCSDRGRQTRVEDLDAA